MKIDVITKQKQTVECNDKFFKELLSVIKDEYCEEDYTDENGKIKLDAIVECFRQDPEWSLNVMYDSIDNCVSYSYNLNELCESFMKYLRENIKLYIL